MKLERAVAEEGKRQRHKLRLEKAEAERIARLPTPMDFADLLEAQVEQIEMTHDDFSIPSAGATLVLGASKAGKTLLTLQTLLSVAMNEPLFGYCKPRVCGPTMLIETDDTNAIASVQSVAKKSGGPKQTPFSLVSKVEYTLGTEMRDWLADTIKDRGLKMIGIDSYTSLRGSKAAGGDVVKTESGDFRMLDQLGIDLGCSILILHHVGISGAGRDWDMSAAGSFGVGQAVRGMIHVERFRELPDAGERLIRLRGRHGADESMVLRLDKERLAYDWVLSGSAAEHFPVLKTISTEIGTAVFGPKELAQATGLSRQQVTRIIAKLVYSDALRREGRGQYRIAKLV